MVGNATKNSLYRCGFRFAAILGLFLSVLSSLAAQTKDEDATRTVLLVCRFAPDAVFSPEQRQLFLESMVVRLGSAVPHVLVREYPDTSLKLDENLDKVASLSGIDAWLEARIGGTMDSAQITFHAKDLQKNTDFFTTEITARIDPRFRNAFGGLWVPVGRLIADTIHPVKLERSIIFSGPPGASVSVDDKKAVQIPASGTLEIVASAPASHQYEAWLAGFRSWHGTVFVEKETRVTLKPIAVIPFSADLGLEWLSFPALRLSWAVLPDTMDIDVGAVFYTAGIKPSEPTDTQPSLFHDYHLINFLVGTRWYPLEHRYAFRPWFGAGAQIRLLTQPTVEIDPISPAGFYVQTGFSYDIIPELAVFFDYLPRFTFSNDASSALVSLSNENQQNTGINYTLVTGPLIVEPWHFMVGLRFQPALGSTEVHGVSDTRDINSLLLQRSLLVPLIDQQQKQFETQKIVGWISLGLGIAGAGLASYGLIDGSNAYQTQYVTAKTSADISAARTRAETDATLLWLGVGVGAAGLITGPLLLFVDPSAQNRETLKAIDTRIEELKKQGGGT